MNNLLTLGFLFVASIILGTIKYGSVASAYKGKTWHIKFVEIWNDFANFAITGLVGYYFIVYRWPMVVSGEGLNTSDFLLFVIFTLGVFGHLCVVSKNVTEGVEAILKRVLERN